MAHPKVQALKERLYKDSIDGTSLLRGLISELVTPACYVLDLGCGKGKSSLDFRIESALSVGCDIAEEVSRNGFVSARVRGDACLLPFRGDTFDLVLMDYVVEHLESPYECACEVFRVLKPGGHLSFRTPNLYHYVAIIGMLSPHWFHELIANRVRGLSGSDQPHAFKTYYRANTLRRVERVFRKAGFKPEQIMLVEREPSYLMFARPALLIGYFYERLVNSLQCLSQFRSNIFAIMTKPAP